MDRFKAAGWLSWLFAASILFPLISPEWAHKLVALFSISIFPYVLVKFGEFLNCWENTKKALLPLIAVHMSQALLSLYYQLFGGNEQSTLLLWTGISLCVCEGLLFCWFGIILYKLKVLKSKRIPYNFILLGSVYILLAAYSYTIVKLIWVILMMSLFYKIGRLLLRGEEEHTEKEGWKRFLTHVSYALSLFLLLIFAIAIVDYYSSKTSSFPEITYTDLLREIDRETVASVNITDRHLRGKLKDGREFMVILPQDASGLLDKMYAKKIAIKFEEPPKPPWWKALFQ